MSASTAAARSRFTVNQDHPRYKWVALSNTTLGVLMATLNSSIVIISLPDIFRGIKLNPLQPGNVSYLLWMLMGFLLVTAVLVVTLGRLGDIYGRVKIYNLGFVVFTVGSVALVFDPFTAGGGAMWLILWRVVQGVGAAMLFANSAAILTDAFPANQRGLALGINQVAAIAGSFIGLIVGGLLAPIDWRLVFFISVPFGIIGTVWSYRSLRETVTKVPAKIDWWGNLLFAGGLTAVLAAITYGIQPYGGHNMGWTNPWVLAGLFGGTAMIVVFCFVERRIADPMFDLSLFKIKAFSAGNLAGLLASVSRGGLQFMLIIWLQGIWLPLHGYSFANTPLWAGIYLLPLTVAFLVAGPLSGFYSDRFGARAFATGGLLLVALSFLGLLLLPTDFNYWEFAGTARAERGRLGPVLLAQLGRDHEQRPGQPPWCRGRHARHVLQRRHVAVDRRLLHHDDHRPVVDAAEGVDVRPAGPRRLGQRGGAGRTPAAGRQPVRRVPRLQPDRDDARRAAGVGNQGCGPEDAYQQGVLPAADLRAVPPRPDHRVHGGDPDVAGRRGGVAVPRWALRPRRRADRHVATEARSPAGRHEVSAPEDLRVSRLTGAGSAHSHRLSEA